MSRMPIDAQRIEVMDDAVAEVLRGKSAEEKLRMIASGWPLLRAMHAFQVRAANPSWPEDRVTAEVNQRMAHGST